MKEVLNYWWHPFYTDLISFALALFGLIISIWRRNQNPKLKPLLFFFLAYFFDLFISLSLIAIYRPYTSRQFYIHDYVDFIDTIVEFLAFYYLIKNHVANIKIRNALNPLSIIFFTSVSFCYMYYKITRPEIDQYFLHIIFAIQASILLVACILYYMDLFKKEPKNNLTALSSFWAITGVLFFMLCTLPFSILGLYLINTNYILYNLLFNIFNIFYCILFLMIIKAYLCKPPVTDSSS